MSKQIVLDAFDADPTVTSTALAKRLGMQDAYIRATLQRNGRRLARGYSTSVALPHMRVSNVTWRRITRRADQEKVSIRDYLVSVLELHA